MHEMRAVPLVNPPYGVAAAAGNYNGIYSSVNGDHQVEVGSDHHQQQELRRGPWTLEEDTLLSHYIARHGEGRWNMLAKCAGLKRTGKSCRLRWLNYLKPDIKRGDLTPKEQLLILELHSKWGNRWSRIAQHLPGRTDNEIKNYWRTRVQRQARQLNIESNGKRFLDAVRCYWMPRLLQKVEQQQTSSDDEDHQSLITSAPTDDHQYHPDQNHDDEVAATEDCGSLLSAAADHHPQLVINPSDSFPVPVPQGKEVETLTHFSNSASVNSLTGLSTDSMTMSFQQQEKILESEYVGFSSMENYCNWNMILGDGSCNYEEMDAFDPFMAADELCQVGGDDSSWVGYGYDVADTLWNLDDTWQDRGIGGMGI